MPELSHIDAGHSRGQDLNLRPSGTSPTSLHSRSRELFKLICETRQLGSRCP
jgi:hypothetical protein